MHDHGKVPNNLMRAILGQVLVWQRQGDGVPPGCT
jgi:hypothetical protein